MRRGLHPSRPPVTKRSVLTVLAVYAVSRVISTALLLVMVPVARDWGCGVRCTPPTLLRFLAGGWDATYYRAIAVGGYPPTLPVDAAGDVVPNAWAFLPVYPAVVRGVMTTGLGFEAAGIAVSVIAGAAAAIALFLLVHDEVGHRPAIWAVALFCFGPVSFVLQTAYAESLFLALLFFALRALRMRRWALGTVLAVVAAFTRPGVVALALALGIEFVVRVLRGRAGEPFPLRDRLALLASAAIISVAGLAWPVIVAFATGVPDGYTRTELSWWTGFVGRVDFVPLSPWFVFWGRYLGFTGWFAVLVVCTLFAWWLWAWRRRVRDAGGDGLVTLSWSVSYALYLLAVFLPQQSLPRIVLPLAPLLGDPAISRSPALRVTLLATGIALQPVAIALLWILGYP